MCDVKPVTRLECCGPNLVILSNYLRPWRISLNALVVVLAGAGGVGIELVLKPLNIVGGCSGLNCPCRDIVS